jgi:hypothetical protein
LPATLVLPSKASLTPRSSRPATAGSVSLVRGTWCIIAYQAYAACLRGRLNSNVRHHTKLRMLRPRPVPTLVDPDTQDLRSARTACIVLLVVNGVLIALMGISLLTGSTALWQLPVFIIAIEALFFVGVFIPMLAYRFVRKKERLKLAASRSLLWFTETLGLAV